MVIRINEDLLSVDTCDVTPLCDKNWQQKVPKWEWLCDEVTSDFLAGGLHKQDQVECECDSADSDDKDSLWPTRACEMQGSASCMPRAAERHTR
jgi:hypothetical protein